MKSRLNHTKFSTVLASFVVLLVPAGGICAGKNHVCNRQFGEVHPEYLKAVKAYADAINTSVRAPRIEGTGDPGR
jgi:hypothetical protein